MQGTDLDYAKMVATIKPYTDKGRPISIAFLNWFLEHIYRLEQVEAEDIICDKSNDRGIDGIYIDENQLEIHVFQSKTKQSGTIGDKDLREFSGTLNQLRTTDALDAFLAGKVDQEIKDKIQKLGVRGLLEKGFTLRGGICN
jgi:Restriction endonuclease